MTVALLAGAALLLEYERGTHRLLWTRSVTRSRWLFVKFTALGVAVTVAGLVFGAVVPAWAGTDDAPIDRFSGDIFGLTTDALVGGMGVAGPTGDRITWQSAIDICGGHDPLLCMEDRGYVRQYTEYQPADRYWRFQWTETGLPLLVTIAFAGVTVHQVTRRAR